MLQTFRGKEPFSRRGGLPKGTGDCPWAGRRNRLIKGFWFRRTGFRFLPLASSQFFRSSKVLAEWKDYFTFKGGWRRHGELRILVLFAFISTGAGVEV